MLIPADTFNGCVSQVIARELALKEKGIPVPGTGRSKSGCGYNKTKNSGVSAHSHIVTKWDDEGEKGPLVRREIRRKERALWMAEAIAEMGEEFYSLMGESDF